MANALETLRDTVATLTETEAGKTLDYITRLRSERSESTLAELFADDSSIHVPRNPFERLPSVEPIRGSGIPASELLVQDRR